WRVARRKAGRSGDCYLVSVDGLLNCRRSGGKDRVNGPVTKRSGRGFAYRPADDVHGPTARRMRLELDEAGILAGTDPR
ncbi:hypothetical protein ACWGIP_29190, partial [Streptomyces sp. NPDC054838]